MVIFLDSVYWYLFHTLCGKKLQETISKGDAKDATGQLDMDIHIQKNEVVPLPYIVLQKLIQDGSKTQMEELKL